MFDEANTRCIVLAYMFVDTTISTADSDNQEYWEVDLQNGYISTKPIFVDNQVIVRTFWLLEEFGPQRIFI